MASDGESLGEDAHVSKESRPSASEDIGMGDAESDHQKSTQSKEMQETSQNWGSMGLGDSGKAAFLLGDLKDLRGVLPSSKEIFRRWAILQDTRLLVTIFP